MQLEFAAAAQLFATLPQNQQLATLHPAYVAADAERSDTLIPCYWVYQEGDAFWYHGFHLCRLPGIVGYDIQSPYGYGGPSSNTFDAAFQLRAWASYRDWLGQQGVAAEFLRFHPLANNQQYYGGDCFDDRPTVWVDLHQADLLAGYETRVRTAIRKAEKNGLQFWWQTFSPATASQFGDFYRAGMQAIAASDFYFFPNSYFSHFARWSEVQLATCQRDGEWLAAGLFLAGGDTLEYHLAATNEAGKKLGATNLLLHGAALRGQAAGLSRLYLGGGTDHRVDNPLLFFKQGFSRHTATFRIGRAIHDPTRYEALKHCWPAHWAANTGKILFYR